MAQITNPAYYAGQQWTTGVSCGSKNSEVCRKPWWFLIGMIAALTVGGKKRRERRKVASR
jgi:hypothetical protein